MAPIAKRVTHQSQFHVPAKASAAISIKVPVEEVQATAIRSAKQRNTDKPVDENSENKVETKSRLTENQILLQVHSHDQTPYASEDRVVSEKRDAHLEPHDRQRSVTALDIYATKYIPTYLKAVNESFAIINQPPQLEKIDYEKYLSTFAGSTFLSSCPSLQLPAAVPCQVLYHQLQASHYSQFWEERFQLELAAQGNHYYGFSLYNTDISYHDPRAQLYKLRVPGLRENAPRLDVGDIVLCRSLLPVLHGQVEKEVEKWLQSRDGLAPGFTGHEYHAMVWSLSRRNEVAILRITNGLNTNLRCNVVFPLQPHKDMPFWRAIKNTALALEHTKQNPWARSMLFPNEDDGVMQTTLSNGLFDLTWFDGGLNGEQKKAIQAVISANYGVVPYLISGPPGTGKTKLLVELAMQLLIDTKKQITPHLLICAPSDAAADTLLVRLAQYLTPTDLLRLNNWTRAFSEVPGQVLPYCYQDSNNLFSLPDFKKMMQYKIVVTSCRDADMLVQARLTNEALTQLAYEIVTAISPSLPVDRSHLVHWTAVLLDEAAQATEPEALVPLTVVMPPVSEENTNVQVIMAGDEYQLGPRLTPKIDDTLVQPDKALSTSLFQRLFTQSLYSGHPLSRAQGLKPLAASMLPLIRPPFSNLVRNYRSHPAILATPSTLFYADTLIPEQSSSPLNISNWLEWPSKAQSRWPVLFHNHSGADSVESVTEGDGTGAGSITNHQEASIALSYVKSLLSHAALLPHKLKQSDIIVLSPFRAQVNRLRQLFRESDLHDINIGPLEAFQGLEARVVVICTTRTRLGENPHPQERFVREDQARSLGVVDEPKRFNVAMTRAKDGLIVIGNAECLTCTKDKCWLAFLGFCARNGLIRGKPLDELDGLSKTEPGKLEKALNWAELIESAEKGRDESASDSKSKSQRSVRDFEATGQRHEEAPTEAGNLKFRLRGRMIDLDEEIWNLPSGDHYFEEQNGDYQDDEDGGNGVEEEEDNTIVSQNMLHQSLDTTGIDKLDDLALSPDKTVDYTRDLEKELENERCETQ